MSVGLSHACARLTSGEVWCWGKNEYGELGTGSITAPSAPVRATQFPNALAVRAGMGVTCAILADRSVACVGRNMFGIFGSNWGPFRWTPVRVLGLP